MVYASSLSKEGSRKDGTVLELRPGRVHAGGHSSYVPLRSIRFPSLDGEADNARQQPSSARQQPRSRPPAPAAATDSRQPSPAQLVQGPVTSPAQPGALLLRTERPQTTDSIPDSPETAAVSNHGVPDANETTLSHWAALPTVRQLDEQLASGLSLSVVPEGQSPSHAPPGRLVRANSADACSPEYPAATLDYPADFSFGPPDRADTGTGSSKPVPADAAPSLSVVAPTAANLQQLPGPPSSSGGGPHSETCSRSSSPGRAPRIWRASAGWWPDGGQPPPPPKARFRSAARPKQPLRGSAGCIFWALDP